MNNILSNEDFGTGYLYTTGQGEFGQLGYDMTDDDDYEAKVPTLVKALEKVKLRHVICGSLQTWVLTENGNVYSFGLNDEGALGRQHPVTNNEDDDDGAESVPDQVLLPQKCVQIAGGDGHCAAILENGQVFAWGSFRVMNGQRRHGVDFRRDEEITKKPVIISQDLPTKVVKIASGAHHLVVLCENGSVFTLGDGSCGQLGRKLPDKYRGDTMKYLLQPLQVKLVARGRTMRGTNIWAGEYTTFIQCQDSLWVSGSNNWHQCGISGTRNIVVYPSNKNELAKRKWKCIAGGEQHTLAVDIQGVAYAFGRNVEGQCGIGEDAECISKPTKIPRLEGKCIKKVAAGSRTSFAIDENGVLFGWGIGEYVGLGNVNTEYHFQPVQMSNEEVNVIDVDGGGQHSAMLMLLKNKK